MRAILIAALVASITPAAALAQAPAPAAPTAGKSYSSAETPIGTLLDDPAAKAVLTKHAPQITQGGQIDQAREFTLKAVQQFAPDVFTDKLLADIDADLAKLPKK